MPKRRRNPSEIALTIVSQGPAVLYLCEADGDYAPSFISSNIQKQLGYTPEEFLSDPDFWVNHIHPEDRERVLQELVRLFDTGHNTHEYRFQHKDGSYRWMYDESSLLEEDDYNRRQIVGYWVDMTEQIAAKQLAEEANEVKSQFLTRMSHELRTPLNSILGFAQLLDTSMEEPLRPRQKEGIEQILKSGWHLVELVNDLLDLATIEADKVELQIEAIDLLASMKDCTDVMRSLAAQREITLSSSIDNDCTGLRLQADPARFRQVVLNLLSNAVKYNRAGGAVTVSCERINTNKIRISVTDTGSGISRQDLETLFEPFNRLYLGTYTQEGTGIGLSITKHLVELMGGEIGVTSEPGQGSTFWIDMLISSLPAKTAAVAETVAEMRAESTLLYIEDNPSHIRLFNAIINSMPGIQLLSAHTPRLGLELAEVHQPDVIVLDICLPGMDGFKVLEQLLANDLTREIPVIAVSANAMKKDIEKALRAGFRRYLTKPINVVEFKKTLDELHRDNAVLKVSEK